jgi:hypothetical protein
VLRSPDIGDGPQSGPILKKFGSSSRSNVSDFNKNKYVNFNILLFFFSGNPAAADEEAPPNKKKLRQCVVQQVTLLEEIKQLLVLKPRAASVTDVPPMLEGPGVPVLTMIDFFI